jgi:hypothetical protein
MTKIRQYNPSDEVATVQLWRDCGLVVPHNSPCQDIARKMKFQADLFLIAVEDGQVIGSVMAGYEGHQLLGRGTSVSAAGNW